MQEDFFAAPLLTLHAPMPEVMAGVWSILRETLLAGQVDRAQKEVVAATLSNQRLPVLRRCAHPDAACHLGSRCSWRAAAGRLRQHPRPAAARAGPVGAGAPGRQSGCCAPPPFADAAAPEIIGTAVAFHYINRMVNVFLGETLPPLPSALQGVTRRLYAATAGKRIVRGLQQGRSLPLVPRADLPDDLAWAAANPAVAGAFSGLAAVIEAAGAQVLPEYMRLLVSEQIYAWNGEAMGISRRWVDEALADAKIAHLPAARLMLTTALASYQVDASMIEEFRAQYPNDAQLIAATAWASFTAARRAGLWLAEPLAVAV